MRLVRSLLGISLRSKIVGLVVSLLLLLSVTVLIQTERSISPFMNQQLDAQGISTGKYIADRSPEYIYRGDHFKLYTLIRDARNSNENIRYIFIIDADETVLVDTFGNALPYGLLAANQVKPSEAYHVNVIDTEEGLVRDIALPLSDGKLGTVRIGMSVQEITQAKSKLLVTLSIATLTFMLIGLVMAYLLAHLLSTPYRRMFEATKIYASGDLSYRIPEWSIQDEGGQLTHAFNLMIESMEKSALEIKELSNMRQGLAEKLMQVQEEERSHLARELHDETSQSLASLRLGLKYTEKAPTLEQATVRLIEVRKLLDQTFDGIRRLITVLRPSVLEEGELGQAVKRYAQEFEKRYGIQLDIEIADVSGKLSGEVASSLYRIVQEALTNIARHAQAQQVSIVLTNYLGEVNLTIEDNGQGFNVTEELAKRVANRKFGLFGIQERVAVIGGSFQIESALAQGTTIYVKVPEGLRSDEENNRPLSG
ncbi:HAMP domain-containing protein [Desulfosporosinus fructosivorans]|uniref:histidine kinase n=2 Tax=Desulfosporosinus fructosivorans TaxID=2018669 RepID=A0A4Z0R410_9FIRM|nr:HAMP domain-containing protein [Desulfosporosinus fructosivorans]